MKFTSVLAIASLAFAQSPAADSYAVETNSTQATTGTGESANSVFSNKRSAHPKMRRTLGLTNLLLGNNQYPPYGYQQPPPPPPAQGPTVFLPQQLDQQTPPPQQAPQQPPQQYAPPPQQYAAPQYGAPQYGNPNYGLQNGCQSLCRMLCPCTWLQALNQGLGFGQQPYYGQYQQPPPPPPPQQYGNYVLVADPQSQNQDPTSKFDSNINSNNNGNGPDIASLQNKLDQLTHQLEAHAGTDCSRAHGPDGVTTLYNEEQQRQAAAAGPATNQYYI